MNTTLLFDFAVDKDTATITITREFAAELDLVWDAWTKPEILDKWVAPRPWRAETKEMDFREGGRWLYAMVSPENVYYWSLVDYTHIEPKSQFISRNSFTDENGNANSNGFTSSLQETRFMAGQGRTTVKVVKKMADLVQLEKFIEMGFKEGMSVTLKNLDELLASQSQRSSS